MYTRFWGTQANIFRQDRCLALIKRHGTWIKIQTVKINKSKVHRKKFSE